MKHYIVNNSFNPKILGHYPQVKDIKQNCDLWDEPKFIEHIHFTKIDFEPITANAILHPKSKLTDLISVTGMGFTRKLLLSGKLKRVFERYRMTGLQFFNSNLFYNGLEIDDYWILNMYEIDMELIDFSKSEIYLTENTFNNIKRLDIRSFEDFLNEKDKIDIKGYPLGIIIERFELIQDIKKDFFVLLNVKGGAKYIVSEKLKKEIEETGCTGIEFQPTELSTIEWTMPGGEREKVYGKM